MLYSLNKVKVKVSGTNPGASPDLANLRRIRTNPFSVLSFLRIKHNDAYTEPHVKDVVKIGYILEFKPL